MNTCFTNWTWILLGRLDQKYRLRFDDFAKISIELAHKITWYLSMLLDIKHFFIFYLFIYCISIIVIIVTTRCFIDMTTQSFCISQETMSFLSLKSMSSSSIDDIKYAFEFVLLKDLNDYIKQYDYFVVIRDTSKNNKGIKSKIYIICNRERKFALDHKRKATRKRVAIFKRIDYSFQCVTKLINNKWMLTKIQRSNHNHDDINQVSHSKLRNYFINQERVMKNIKA